MKNRRERAKLVRQRKVATLAAYSRQHTVKNCTIPKINDSNLIDIECPWDETKTIKAVKDTAVWDNDKWYKEPREAAKKAIREAKYDPKYNLEGKYKYKGKRKPWYMLDNRKTYHYEERKKSWGANTDFFRVPSEATEMYNKTVFKPNKSVKWYINQVVHHKITKWEKRKPCPIKVDKNSPDLFEEQYVIPWKTERELALERIRDLVVSMYDKLPLTGRFKKTDNEFVEKPVAEIKDANAEGHKINELDPNKSKLLKIAQKKTNETKVKHKNLVCTNLKDHKREKGRIILPKAA